VGTPPTETDSRQIDVAIVGAGIAGLAAASVLSTAGRRVVVLEKSRGVGGRMATRRLGEAVCDHGAQQFSVKGRAFGRIVAEAETAGFVDSWCRLFPSAETAQGPVKAPLDEAGHARWRGIRGMTALPKQVAASLPETVRTQTRVASISSVAGRVRLEDEAGGCLTAAATIVTAPVPQAIDLFKAGGLIPPLVNSDTWELLDSITYEPCFSLMLVLDRPSRLPEPGGLQVETGPIAWITDNQQKGISPLPSLTIQARGDFSREHFDDDPAEVTRLLAAEAASWIDGDPMNAVLDSSLQRWKFAFPQTVLKTPLVPLSTSPPVVCCGDAFGGGSVENAASSGLAAARWLERLGS
jgi:renalase